MTRSTKIKAERKRLIQDERDRRRFEEAKQAESSAPSPHSTLGPSTMTLLRNVWRRGNEGFTWFLTRTGFGIAFGALLLLPLAALAFLAHQGALILLEGSVITIVLLCLLAALNTGRTYFTLQLRGLTAAHFVLVPARLTLSIWLLTTSYDLYHSVDDIAAKGPKYFYHQRSDGRIVRTHYRGGNPDVGISRFGSGVLMLLSLGAAFGRGSVMPFVREPGELSAHPPELRGPGWPLLALPLAIAAGTVVLVYAARARQTEAWLAALQELKSEISKCEDFAEFRTVPAVAVVATNADGVVVRARIDGIHTRGSESFISCAVSTSNKRLFPESRGGMEWRLRLTDRGR